MIGPHQFPPAGWDDEVFRRGGSASSESDEVFRHGGPASSESDFFSGFFGHLSPDVSPRVAAAAAASHDAAAVTDAVREEEVESLATKATTKSGRASTSGAKRKEAAGGSSDHHQKRKRNRTTEMHNMTERRRRDKIKGKLKALQDLIPNSHKLDRASLLDEAIAYVKTLQMQVQLMSNSGLCHSPCMPPSPGACLLPHSLGTCLHMPFSPFSRMGMGYGMGRAGMGCPVGPPLMSLSSPHPSTSYVQIPGFSTIPSFCPLSQGVPFPMPEFAAAMTTSIPSPPILQAGPFSSHRVDGGSQEAVTTQG